LSKPTVAIVGRPNTGKSTLLNRIVGRPQAIIENLPGTTRDRNLADVAWQGKEFTLVDTGGLEIAPETSLAQGVKAQVDNAINEANLLLLLVDAKDGLIPADREIADKLRKTGKPVLVVANKADNQRLETEALEFYELGLGELFIISAHHGRGVAELLDRIASLLPAPPSAVPRQEPIKVAIAGRPNVGKSMLLNALVGEERCLVDEKPGTTRDAIDTMFDCGGQNILFIDTAGIRRRGKVQAGIEKYSVARTLRAIDRADIVLLVLDAIEIATAQDTHIAGYVQEVAKGIIIVVNKWDLIRDKDVAGVTKTIRSQFKFASYAPILYTSAKTGRGVDKVMPEVLHVYQERQKRLPTAAVNSIIQQAVTAHVRPRDKGKELKVFYATQADINPPTFVFFTNDTKLIHFSYRRFLENRLRQAYDFTGTPLRLIFKNRGRVTGEAE
jgi:GTP-binding protein